MNPEQQNPNQPLPQQPVIQPTPQPVAAAAVPPVQPPPQPPVVQPPVLAAAPPQPVVPPVAPAATTAVPLAPIMDTGAPRNGKATIGLVLGAIAMIAWIFPLVGLPVSITGLVFSIKGLKSLKRTLAIVGIVLSSIGLLITVGIVVFRLVQLTGGSYSYGSVTKTSSFTGSQYTDLVPASSKFLQAMTKNEGKFPGTAKHNVTAQGIKITVVSYDENGNPKPNGRFGMFVAPGSTLICNSDYKNNVSFMLNFDPPGGDGNTAAIDVFDQSNCLSSSKGMHGSNGDIKITSKGISAYDDVPQSTKSVAEGVSQQLRSDANFSSSPTKSTLQMMPPGGRASGLIRALLFNE